MSLTAVAHLNFYGEARAVLQSCLSVFGGELAIASYGDFGMSADRFGVTWIVDVAAQQTWA
ncbi:PhnB protein [Lentzea waywayandensis]|uniref:PhnB protein n=1 Tax=Lentzea waywayandensis TaxID=84724 RepID=A0A1I6FGW6_9PSEU|nr:PhnB protein [Lentzea waywayandensis]